ncbi:hypothetical protein [Cysteiniphilum sp. QT6929]|uniref:HvfA family oxazolone/thioamide-modified RiPP metallophore n=1 Tax=Cysteiniphilum sp. QT6929 TaxID=2975055 RepID=UPI0024B3B4FB|nr:hypothetical protein [Cysteiniphilum sp. QT6929]WHN65275.1 hypothetical protein NYP54_09535 [Cysteiniphilum sp. QT6929]
MKATKSLIIASALAFGMSTHAFADSNFQSNDMNNGYANGQNGQSSQVTDANSTNNDKSSDMKCGTGSCGSDHTTDKSQDGKCGSGSCGASSDKSSDMKCGSGSCGSDDDSGDNDNGDQ